MRRAFVVATFLAASQQAAAQQTFSFVGSTNGTIWVCACSGTLHCTSGSCADCETVPPPGMGDGDYECCPTCCQNTAVPNGTMTAYSCSGGNPSGYPCIPGGGASGAACIANGMGGYCKENSPGAAANNSGVLTSLGSATCQPSEPLGSGTPDPAPAPGGNGGPSGGGGMGSSNGGTGSGKSSGGANACTGPNAGGLGGTSNVGDPMMLHSRQTRHRVTDFSLKTTLGSVGFDRTYVGSDWNWLRDSALNGDAGPYIPKPFGTSPGFEGSLRWTHSLYSFVKMTPTLWLVRAPDGSIYKYTPCGGGTSACFASPQQQGEVSDLLYFDPSGDAGQFTLYDSAGRYAYHDVWTSGDGGSPFYFLSRMDDPQYPVSGSSRTLYTLTYAVPDAGTCPGLSASGNPGVPYVAAMHLPEGGGVVFKYASYPSQVGSVSTECVLSGAALASNPNAGSGATTPLVDFTYSAAFDGSVTPSAGYVSSASYAGGSRSESYVYRSGNAHVWQVWEGADSGTAAEILEHTYTLSPWGEDMVSTEARYQPNTAGTNLLPNTPLDAGCDAGTPFNPSAYCTDIQQLAIESTTPSRGDNIGNGETRNTFYALEGTQLSETRRSKSQWEHTCITALDCASVSSGESNYVNPRRVRPDASTCA
jgi:hypothetical protein